MLYCYSCENFYVLLVKSQAFCSKTRRASVRYNYRKKAWAATGNRLMAADKTTKMRAGGTEDGMQPPILRDISPFVRCVKITRSEGLAGEWLDYDHVFTYIEQGKADFILNGVKYEAAEGDVILMPPLLKHLIYAAPGSTLVQYIVHFDLYEAEEREKWRTIGITDKRQLDVPPRERALERMPPLVRVRAADRVELRRQFHRLLELYREEDSPVRRLRMKAVAIELIALYLRSLDAAATDGVETKGWVPIERCIAYIHGHYTDPEMTNARIAGAIGFSPGYLSMLFKEQLGTTIHKYITSVRIEQAKRLILEGGATLTEIAERVGFASIHHFSRIFRKETGVPPSRYAAESKCHHDHAKGESVS